MAPKKKFEEAAEGKEPVVESIVDKDSSSGASSKSDNSSRSSSAASSSGGSGGDIPRYEYDANDSDIEILENEAAEEHSKVDQEIADAADEAD